MGIFGSNYGVNYEIASDTTDPTISILTPLDNAEVTSSLTVTMIASALMA